MKRLLFLLIVLLIAGMVAGPVMAGAFGPGTDQAFERGPAPNAGDCVPDGSGWDNPNEEELPYGSIGENRNVDRVPSGIEPTFVDLT